MGETPMPLRNKMVAADQMWPVGVCFPTDRAPNRARTVSYAPYIQEILSHAGVCYATVPTDQLAATLPRLRILVTVSDRDLGVILAHFSSFPGVIWR